jgi:hypothetical protein
VGENKEERRKRGGEEGGEGKRVLLRTWIVTCWSSTSTDFVKLRLGWTKPDTRREGEANAQIRPDSRLVLVTEPLVHVLIH